MNCMSTRIQRNFYEKKILVGISYNTYEKVMLCAWNVLFQGFLDVLARINASSVLGRKGKKVDT